MEINEIDYKIIRSQSWTAVKKFGLPISGSLPLLDMSLACQSSSSIVDRVFGMLCVAACAYGFEKTRALAWIERETKFAELTPAELKFLQGSIASQQVFTEQIEGMWALCWAIGVVPELDFAKPCASDFVRQLPDLKADQDGGRFRSSAVLVSQKLIASKTDFAYCLHWALVESQRAGKQPLIPKLPVVVERRRSLEWVFSGGDWDDISLDT